MLKSQKSLPFEVALKKSGSGKNRRQATPEQSSQVLDLAPYLEDLSVITDNTSADTSEKIRFTIRRLPKDHNEANNGVNPGNPAGNPTQYTMVKPSWVLGLIDSTVKWSVVRTDIQLDPIRETVHSQ
jgi:hypothetical protein